jgi:hypothetical protein
LSSWFIQLDTSGTRTQLAADVVPDPIVLVLQIAVVDRL